MTSKLLRTGFILFVLGLAGFALSGCSGTSLGGWQPAYTAWAEKTKQAGFSRDDVWLGAMGTVGGVQTVQEARNIYATHKGKKANFVGYVYDLELKGNKAYIEIAPVYNAEREIDCRFGASGGLPLLACLKQRRGLFRSSVTCVVNDWSALNAKTGDQIALNNQTRLKLKSSWDHVAIIGTLSNLKTKTRNFSLYRSFGSDPFGAIGGLETISQTYQNFTVTNCKVAIYRNKVL